ncbi:DUF2511 domain-containing protein [Motiliproteus sp.]|uniref:DUF2511 domain-containing protein n=1 Tax=Motiliproteus sp. TaxID=1898955 RepID=UPI003BAA8592
MGKKVCRRCAAGVSTWDSNCSECGAMNPSMSINDMIHGVIMLGLIVGAVVIFWGSDETEAVSRNQFGAAWPFTVEAGSVRCYQGAAVFRADGVSYQLNGVAGGQGYASIDPIWRDNPDLPGAKIGLGPILEIALDLCD